MLWALAISIIAAIWIVVHIMITHTTTLAQVCYSVMIGTVPASAWLTVYRPSNRWLMGALAATAIVAGNVGYLVTFAHTCPQGPPYCFRQYWRDKPLSVDEIVRDYREFTDYLRSGL